MNAVLIVCHGSLADGLISAVEQIMGPQPGLKALSNQHKGQEGLQQEILDWLEGCDGHPVILVDFPGSSCYRFARVAVRKSGQSMPVVAGVSLGMLLGYLGKRDTLAADKIAETLIRDGQRCIVHS